MLDFLIPLVVAHDGLLFGSLYNLLLARRLDYNTLCFKLLFQLLCFLLLAFCSRLVAAGGSGARHLVWKSASPVIHLG